VLTEICLFRKKFYLFSPSEHRNLYVHPKTHAMHRHAQVDIDAPDLEKYTGLERAKGFTVLVEPGTVFYLPPFWFHQVESLSDTISVNTWYPSTIVVSKGVNINKCQNDKCHGIG
jgi:hypoxia-inducible factor 1-alpha inhibitor (HIF hydroxylase)